MLKSKPPRIPILLTELEEHLDDQMSFLRASMAAFDQGNFAEFRRMALTLRILLYDGGQSRSLLGQMGLKDTITFESYAAPLNPNNLLSEFSLASIEMSWSPEGMNSKYVPALDTTPAVCRRLSFDSWWDEPVLRTHDRDEYTRGEIVLVIANQSGGAHVDPGLDPKFHKLAKSNGLGFIARAGDNEFPIEDIEKAYVRHMAFETERSVGFIWDKYLRKRFCECGSGRQFRYCHGKQA